MRAEPIRFLTPEEYLAREETSPIRHEYWNGEVFAMTGGTLRHNAIAGNLFVALRGHLKGTPCRVFINDVRVHVARDNAFYYPDLVVTCDARHATLAPEQKSIDTPVLVIEVLSESTEGIDRREKFASYRKLATLKEYALVSQDARAVEVIRRQGEVGWERVLFEPGDEVEFASLDFRLPMAAIYDDTGI